MARPKTNGPGLTYAAAGVNIGEKDRFTESLEATMRRTFGPRVIQNPGGFAGLFRLDFNERLFARNYRDPVLVACCDGVGTKVKLAAELGIYNTVGIDLVAMNVNDLVVQGAEPLFFLDYIAVPTVDRGMLTHLVESVAEGCRQASCALLGGETANMPDVYAPGDFDLAGFCVGVVELRRAIKPNWVRPGDVILGLASAGIHSNGYSLVRRVVKEAQLELGRVYEDLAEAGSNGRGRRRAGARPGRPEAGAAEVGAGTRAGPARPGLPRERTLGEVLLTPTRIYAGSIVRLMRSYKVKNVVTGMAHITGSGLAENLVRAIPPGCDAVIDRSSWEVPAVFRFIQAKGRIADEEMRRVFNLGIGYCVIVKPAFADSVHEQLEKLGERVFRIGKVVKGKGQVRES